MSTDSAFLQRFFQTARDAIIPVMRDIAFKIPPSKAQTNVDENLRRPRLSVLPAGFALPATMTHRPFIDFIPVASDQVVTIQTGGTRLAGAEGFTRQYHLGNLSKEVAEREIQAFPDIMLGSCGS